MAWRAGLTAQIGSAFLLGLFWQQVGWLAHDVLHHQVFRNRWANNWAGLFFGNISQVRIIMGTGLGQNADKQLFSCCVWRLFALAEPRPLSSCLCTRVPNGDQYALDTMCSTTLTVIARSRPGLQRGLVEVEAQHAPRGAERAGGRRRAGGGPGHRHAPPAGRVRARVRARVRICSVAS